MLHIKFQGNRLIGSEEEDFLKVFTIYERGGHVGSTCNLGHLNSVLFIMALEIW